jgi:hypothetical protein
MTAPEAVTMLARSDSNYGGIRRDRLPMGSAMSQSGAARLTSGSGKHARTAEPETGGVAAARYPLQRWVRSRWHLIAAQALTLAWHLGKYATYSAVPGHDAALPRGWYLWTDQSVYLRSLVAFLHGDLDPDKHFYPPLYALVGAPFYLVTKNHPWFLVDLATMLWSAHVFMRLAERYVPRAVALLLLVLTVLLNGYVLTAFVVPWTSTVTTAVVSTLVWLLMRAQDRPEAPGWRAALGFGAVAGLLFLARPLDAVFTGVLGLALLLTVHRRSAPSGARAPWIPGRPAVLATIGLAAGYAAGIVAFVGFNLTVYGHPLGDYGDVVAGGYAPGQAPFRAYSLVLDSQSLFLQPGSAMVDKYPWLLLSLVGIGLCAFRADSLLRPVALTVVAQACLYAPYVDLLPINNWRFGNVHYYKWMFPYLGLLAWLAVVWIGRLVLVAANDAGRRRTSMGLATVAALALLVPHAVVERQPLVPTVAVTPTTFGSSLPRPGTIVKVRFPRSRIDFLDLSPVSGGWTGVLMGGDALSLDGDRLRAGTDYRLLAAPGGVRVQLTTHRTASTMVVRLGPGLQVAPDMRAEVSTYRLVEWFQ